MMRSTTQPTLQEPPRRVAMIEIDDLCAGQRIDNFLFRLCKGVPKSHLYRLLRNGEIRINKKRADCSQRLAQGDWVRIPPLRIAQRDHAQALKQSHRLPPAADFPVLYEDDHLLAVDKPAGIAVHGGSGVSFGIIETLRRARPHAPFLELAHRLDRETSGILLIAKKRSALLHLHAQIRAQQIDKRYLACVRANWRAHRRVVTAPLRKYLTAAGERRACMHPDGREACTVFHLVKRYAGYALLEAELKTGRTHQIRVHLAHCGAPIAGDDKYGDFALNRALAREDARPRLQRMFLHAYRLCLQHPAHGTPLELTAPLPGACAHFLNQLEAACLKADPI